MQESGEMPSSTGFPYSALCSHAVPHPSLTPPREVLAFPNVMEVEVFNLVCLAFFPPLSISPWRCRGVIPSFLFIIK